MRLASFLVQVRTLDRGGNCFLPYLVNRTARREFKGYSGKAAHEGSEPVQAFIDSRNFMCMAFVFLFAINIFINFGNTSFDQAF